METSSVSLLHIEGRVDVGEAEVFASLFVVEIFIFHAFEKAVNEALELCVIAQVVGALS